jgi:hypothetical protein
MRKGDEKSQKMRVFCGSRNGQQSLDFRAHMNHHHVRRRTLFVLIGQQTINPVRTDNQRRSMSRLIMTSQTTSPASGT